MRFSKSYFLIAVFVAATSVLLIQACKKVDDKVPHNPYDDIVRGDTTTYGIPLDSLTITYLHAKVLSVSCALPGCHEGHFEPDFRTPQSSFSTLVYAPIIKNNLAGDFKYRVIPFDTTNSVFHERVTNCCFVTSNDRMPQDNIGVALPDSSLNLISSWIMHGARDMFGNVPRLPNKEPVIAGNYYLAFDTISLIPPFATPTLRYDTVRLDGVYYNPFVVPADKGVFYMALNVSDDSTAQGAMLVNKLKVSTNADDFSGGWQYTATFINYPGITFWLLTIPTSNLPANDTLYMRYYMNDGDHPNNTEFPTTPMLYPYKTFWSFIRQ
ncbi:MAG TPA: hypothetical protein PLW44_01620 [Chitinophagales bacterium]|nr:hypothetical protein [Chitinophagales bacterium]